MSAIGLDEDWCPVQCGCGGERVECWQCFGEGRFDCYDDDPINYAEGEEYESCRECRGRGFFWLCADPPPALKGDKP